jgi:MATE family multidrug resistance protein
VVFACFLSGLGRTKIVMKAQVIMMLINIPISYTLIFLLGLEVKGAALGSVISGSIGAALMAYDIFKKESREDIGLDKIFSQKSMRAIFTLDMDMIKTYVRYGAPMAFEFTFILLAFNTFVGLFHSYGEVQALAMTIVYNWDFLLFMPMWGVNMGLSTLVGKFMGARRPDLARLSTAANFKVNMVLTIGISIFLLIFTDWAVRVFLTAKDIDIKAVMDLALPMLRLAILYFFAMAISLALSGTLRAAGDTKFCLVITASAHWLNLLFAFWAIKIAFWPPLQTWSVHVWIYWIEVVFFIYRYLQGPWESIEMVENFELGAEVQ